MSSPDIRRNEQQLAAEILEYFQKNPFAKDSCRGIASCWVREDFDAVERALFILVRRGVISKEVRRGTAFYRLNKRRSSRRRSRRSKRPNGEHREEPAPESVQF